MKIVHITLSALLLSSSVVSTMSADAATTKQPVLIKKLKKAWESNWVKAGVITGGCAVLYALGTKLTAAPVCTGTVNCGACHKVSTALVANNTLFWKVVGVLSGIATLGFGYAYYDAQQKDAEGADSVAASQEQSNGAQSAHFDDNFFAFEGSQEDDTQEYQADEEYNPYNENSLDEIIEVIEQEETDNDSSTTEVLENAETKALLEDITEETILPETQITQSFL